MRQDRCTKKIKVNAKKHMTNKVCNYQTSRTHLRRQYAILVHQEQIHQVITAYIHE